MLAKFYGAIEPDGNVHWEKLAIGLAKAHVPGLQRRRSRGPGRPEDVAAKYTVYLEVLQALHEDTGLTVAGACRQLSDRAKRSSQTAETIEARFHEAKARVMASVASDQIELDPKTGYPIHIPSDGGIEVIVAFDRFRMRYCNMRSVLL